MIRKLLCWLGFHRWEERIGYCSCKGCAWYEDSGLHIRTGNEMSDKIVGLLMWFGVIIYFIALLYFTF